MNKNVDAKITAILQAVGLQNYAQYYPDNLSRGQKQRIAIARTFNISTN
nr:ATP-binding cassette domain-containing protein [Nostoc sp. TCL26-01]